MLQKVTGIVIRTVNYGESNKVVTLFTEELGKVAVMARGAKKPGSRLHAASQPFVEAVYIFPASRGLGQLKSSDVITSYPEIRKDVERMAYAVYLLELVDKTVEDRVPNRPLYRILNDALQALNAGMDPEIITHHFELRIMYLLGVAPVLTGCVRCNDVTDPMFFSVTSGGFLCSRHQEAGSIQMSERLAKLLYLLSRHELSEFSNVPLTKETRLLLRQLFDAYMDSYSGLNLKTKRVLDQMQRLYLNDD
ncbi:DNA repair protein RecO [Exiguobacterium sp. SH3S2]|uniref:DNA repair protein RecO n=1 Tax=unclassified Exiguobacterium TaxID=2644629 RepID=UPI00103BE990|nr:MULTISPECIES: DNA repair protein RecO [unclassified Exiguobacterium]TCI25703.1 DNA repair protein RecO [Exiguobacterium sp. SH5S4]TCI48726.1 DNA repair protein RecO [Exiguobacterium sp. SH3S3]TCI56960.1 DNA repair protein RecO [Exiguobacterium sp. SH5S13]TCI63591.1 DNA repair protein RecO [Exiguobacterium sp. SH3S2]TCI64714.1 DNA repair protein RecO [Exiguobacterium sp. SH3S1]